MLLSNLKYLFLLFEKVKTYNKYMRTIQFREAICEAMSEEMRRDEKVFLIGEENLRIVWRVLFGGGRSCNRTTKY